MASSIYHGKPGSYKTSTAVWFHILPALRKGRFVCTNVEGLYSLEEIEKILGEKFPETAYLFRVSTLNDIGVNTMAKWFHWLPLGAFIVIDEIQNLYNSKDRTDFKVHDTNRAVNTLDRILDFPSLPDNVKYLSQQALISVVDDGYTDDMGISERDSNGHVLYPVNIKDALMRHRKYNWDIIGCTPEIAHVHTLYRGVSEKAVSHRSFDFVPIPWFQRRPRTHEHNPMEKGIRPVKGEPVRRPKVPVKVFSLYKSTQTGKNNRSGVNENPFKNRATLFKIFIPLSIVLGFIFLPSFYGSDSKKPDSKQVGSTSPAAASSVSKTDNAIVGQGTSISSGDTHNPIFNDAPDFLAQLNVEQLFIVGHVQKSKFLGIVKTQNGAESRQTITDYFVFSASSKDAQYTFNSEDLKEMGYTIKKITNCYVQINNVVRTVHSFCNPSLPASEPDSKNESILAGI